MKDQPTLEKFLQDVNSHRMTVLRDDGLYRHVRFAQPDSVVGLFDLVTWPGRLCFTGDMGTFVFSRIADMFEFFRCKPGPLKINPDYWSEKAIAIDSTSGVKEFREDEFKEHVKDAFDDWAYDEGFDSEAKRQAWDRLERDVFSFCDGEHEIRQALINWKHEDRQPFEWAWEMNSRVFTYRFIWCCYAVVWGIGEYDQADKKETKEAQCLAT